MSNQEALISVTLNLAGPEYAPMDDKDAKNIKVYE